MHPRNRKSPLKKTGYFSRAGWLPKEKLEIKSRFQRLRMAMLFLIAVPAVALGSYSAYLWTHKDEAVRSARGVFDGLKSIRDELLKLDTGLASDSLDEVGENLDNLDGMSRFMRMLPVLNQVPEAISKVRVLVDEISLLNQNIADLKDGGLGIAFKGSGGRFLALLRNIKKNIDKIGSLSADLTNRASKYDSAFKEIGGDYISFSSSLIRFNESLDALIAVLERPGETHFALQFENPSEIRPAGGFSGSYGDLVFEGGEISKLEVQDIYYPGHFSDYKIVPPLQLHGIVTKWATQDANWFFDFRTSGRQFIDFLELSDVYKDKGIKFEGVVALNVRVFEDILGVIGDIELPEYKLTLNSSNFLRQIQEEVEAGRDKIPGKNPKKVLTYVAPIAIERLKALPDEDKAKVMNLVAARFANKDIKLYFKDMELESLLLSFGGGGEVYDFPAGVDGDYLAVVNANVAGGKSDAYMSQDIALNSFIDGAGEIRNSLAITRAHSGEKQKEWWYRATNQNFIKVFTLPRSRLAHVKGSASKIVKPQIDYIKGGYQIDADLSALEKTLVNIPEFNMQMYEESGKSSFGTWLNVVAGKSKTLEMSYFNSRKVTLKAGNKYEFVFDKQSGVESNLKYTVQAPPGFVWAESKSDIFTYSSQTLPARLVLELTLESTNNN